MNNDDLIMALGKVIIATAWADGEISEDEAICLKDLLWRLPALHARQWYELEIYLDSPVGPAERERLVSELRALTTSAEQRALVLNTLEEMVSADGSVTDDERAVATEVRNALETADAGAWGSLSRMLIGRRAQATVAGPNREVYLNDFVRNRVYYTMRRRLAEENVDWHIADDELRRLGLAGGLLALVARVSEEVTSEERAAMAAALQSAWALPPESAQFVVEIALADGEKLDLYSLVRELSAVTTEEERRALLDALFAVAASDERASFDETEQIRLIAQGLKLSHQEFIDAKLKVPRDRRAG